MDLLRTHKRRTVASEFFYIVLNVGLVVALLAVLWVTQSLLLAILVVCLSKWRVFAVRPRYWMAHIQTNLVDAIVGVSIAILMYIATGDIAVQIGLGILYIIWLLLIKPRSKRSYIVVQAGAALFLGMEALFAISYNTPGFIVVFFSWVIGYAAARHVLTTYDEAYRSILALTWGFFVAQLGWLFYHWTFAYSLPGFGALKLAQAAIITLVVSFVAYKFYDSVQKYQRARLSDTLLPSLLAASVTVILLVVFNTVSISGI